MVLVDTSVWVEHLRKGNSGLATLLDEGDVICHPFIIGELACGNLKNRDEILRLLNSLDDAAFAEHEEVMRFIETQGLMGQGLGFIDMHLLVSARLSGISLWTLDKRLDQACSRLGLRYEYS
ncbi:MAG: type II toxin-antitoxin system VapC family toxin [Thermoleophilia bacterium]